MTDYTPEIAEDRHLTNGTRDDIARRIRERKELDG